MNGVYCEIKDNITPDLSYEPVQIKSVVQLLVFVKVYR